MHWYMSWVGTGLGHAWNCLHEAQNFHGSFCCSFFCSTSIVGLGYVAGRGGRGGEGRVKVRGKHS